MAAMRRLISGGLSGGSMRQGRCRRVFPLLKEDNALHRHSCAGRQLCRPREPRACERRQGVQLRAEPVHEVFEIPAGGIRLEGRVGDVRIPTGQISFESYRQSIHTTERRPIAQNVMTGDVVLFRKAPTTSCRITVKAIRWCAPTSASTDGKLIESW